MSKIDRISHAVFVIRAFHEFIDLSELWEIPFNFLIEIMFNLEILLSAPKNIKTVLMPF